MIWCLWVAALASAFVFWIQDRQIRALQASRNLQEDLFKAAEDSIWEAIELSVRSDMLIASDVARLRDHQLRVGSHTAKALLSNDARIQELADYVTHREKVKGFLQ